MNPSTIICPKCQNKISIDEALSHQLSETLKKEFEEKREKERSEERRKMTEWKEKLEKEQLEKEQTLKQNLENEIKKKLIEQSEVEQKQIRDELEEKKKQLQESKSRELEFIKKQEQLEEREKNLELELKRQLMEERNKISELAEKRVKDEYQLTLAEKDKMAQDLLKQIEELKQKATQGSQQMQGEILELELEQVLKAEFPLDEILPVGKGVNGADVLQKVRDSNGRECGIIVWESKRTKNWDDKWIPKLKDDMRASKSDLAILISTAMPQGLSNFGFREGVYITSFENFLSIAKIMRLKIIELMFAKLASEGVNDKKEILWKYLTGNEFRQRVESIVEAFNSMKSVMDKEKQYFTKKWAAEEKLIDKVITQTIGIHGDLQGLMGASLPQIKSLEMDNFEIVETTQLKISDNNATMVTTSVTKASASDPV